MQKHFAFNRPAVEEIFGWAAPYPPTSFFHGPVTASFYIEKNVLLFINAALYSVKLMPVQRRLRQM
ncbi:hypothetical protein C6Y45_12680 [Alkalicoccus saliphilus]|uniref:Uncharacterized protein n=1 Tax=Alkalicoccus saliphilus TaxID=200989 RepID=A0A2T4U414_9BACI|nr:hypothetical protein C6Y45_12680 [Alkalicoccus saliphilus]